MIYLDTSAALAHLLSEDLRPPEELWQQSITSSRLLEYELWTRINCLGLGKSHGEAVRGLLGRVSFLELTGPVLERALHPFPVPVRALDALHLASIDFLRAHGQEVELVAYDKRLLSVARRLKLKIHAAFE